ncbi:MAG: thiol-disulfide oxidoreductase DCC family protein [Bacteroidota bacterium]
MNKDNPLILFDGVCNFCNYWVNFAIRHDRKKALRFSTIQGETAKKLLPAYHISTTSLSSVIFIDKGKIYTQSSAALRICRHLDGGWKLFYGFFILPKTLRDAVYNIIARNRYKWFGKQESCRVPTPALKERFLD